MKAQRNDVSHCICKVLLGSITRRGRQHAQRNKAERRKSRRALRMYQNSRKIAGQRRAPLQANKLVERGRPQQHAQVCVAAAVCLRVWFRVGLLCEFCSTHMRNISTALPLAIQTQSLIGRSSSRRQKCGTANSSSGASLAPPPPLNI